MATNEPRYAPYPAEIKGATMVSQYNVLTFQEQTLADVQRSLRVLSHTYKGIIKRYEDMGGTVYIGEYDNGTPNPAEWWLQLGSTTLNLTLDRNMNPMYGTHHMDFRIPPIVKNLEIAEISKALEAIIYREAPNKAELEMTLCNTNLRNGQMVNGIQEIADRIKADTLLLTQALSGANIEAITMDDIYKSAARHIDQEDSCRSV